MMSNKVIPLTTPIIKITTNVITTAEISINSVILSKSANITVILKDSYGAVIEVKQLIIEGEDYLKWGSDDDYIVNYVLNTIN